MGNYLKKAFSTFVAFVTIFGSVGVGALAFPVTAQAATLNAGDLIKASGPAVYFYANDGMRYVFPNEKTFFSWFSDFSSVKTITDGELAAINLGKNVTMRPGTNLVKITTDDKTYAVTKCGTLHWIESEAIAKALYGDAWNTRIVDVPDAYFGDYVVGASVSSNVHPNGQLVSYSGDTEKYVVWDGLKRKIAGDSAFTANKWNMADMVMTAIAYTNGTDVTTAEPDNFWTVACGGAAPQVGGDVTVSLSSDTPAGATVPKNAMSVPMIKVNLTAGSTGANVSGLHFHRVGVGVTSDFANVYLYDSAGNRLTTGRSVNATTNMVEFNSLNITMPANSSQSYYIYADFSSPTNTGGNHAFELGDAASVVLSGTGTVSGSFPVRGNVFVVGTALAGAVDIQKGPQPANPNIGAKDAEISSFKLTASTNDLRIHRVTLYQGGDINNADLKNFALYQGTTKVASATEVSSKGQIVLNFDTPYLLPNGVTRVFSLRADVAGRAGRTVRTYVEYATDIYAVDTVYNSGAAVTITNFDNSGSNYIEVTTQGGQLTFAYNGPAASNIAKGRLGTVLYKFSLTSPDNDLEIRNLRMQLQAVSGQLKDGTTLFFRNLKVVNLANDKTLVGPKELTTGGSDTLQDLVFNETFNIKAGETMDLALVADLANSDDALYIDKQYRGIFQPFVLGDVKIVDTGESLALSKIVPNAVTNGNNMTVKASSLEVGLSSTPFSGTLVKKAQDKPVTGLTLTAGSQSDVTITNLLLKCQADIGADDFATAGALANCDERVTSLSVWDGDTQVGLARVPDTTTGEASITNMNLKIDKGTTKNLTVKATLSSAASTTHQDKLSVGVASANGVTAQDEDANTIDPTVDAKLTGTAAGQQFGTTPSVSHMILNSGSITVAAEGHPAQDIVIARGLLKDVWVPFAKYKVTAQFEDMNIDLIRVKSLAGGDNANFRMVAVAQNGDVKGTAQFESGATGEKDVQLTGNEITVPKDGSVSFELWAKMSDIQASSTVTGALTGVTRTGHQPGLGLVSTVTTTGDWDANYTGNINLRITGAASGERVYFASGDLDANNMVLRKSKPVVTRQSLTNTVFNSGSEQELYRVQIGADSAGSVALKQIVFNVSKSANVSLTGFKVYRNASEITSAGYTVYNAETGADLKTTGVPAATSSVRVAVAFTTSNSIESSISGSGNTYSLRATVSSTSGSGNNVTTSFFRDPVSNNVARAYLKNSSAVTSGGTIFVSNAEVWNLDTGAVNGAPDGTANFLGTFLWSDNSEINHSSADQVSFDWTNDLLVEDLTQTSSVSN